MTFREFAILNKLPQAFVCECLETVLEQGEMQGLYGIPGPDIETHDDLRQFFFNHQDSFEYQLALLNRVTHARVNHVHYKPFYLGAILVKDLRVCALLVEQMIGKRIALPQGAYKVYSGISESFRTNVVTRIDNVSPWNIEDVGYNVPIVHHTVDKSEKETYQEEASKYVESNHGQRVAAVFMILSMFVKKYPISRIVAPSDGSGVCYEACKMLRDQGVTITCLSYDPTLQMIEEAKKKGNVVTHMTNEKVLDVEGVVFVSHFETLDPGFVVHCLSKKREVIVYETAEPFMGRSLLTENGHGVWSSFPIVLSLPLVDFRSKISSSYHLLDREYYVSDPTIVPHLSLSSSIFELTVKTLNYGVYEACKQYKIPVTKYNGERIVGVYGNSIDLKFDRYFNIFLGVYHKHPYDTYSVQYTKCSKDKQIFFYQSRHIFPCVDLGHDRFSLVKEPYYHLFEGRAYEIKQNHLHSGTYISHTSKNASQVELKLGGRYTKCVPMSSKYVHHIHLWSTGTACCDDYGRVISCAHVKHKPKPMEWQYSGQYVEVKDYHKMTPATKQRQRLEQRVPWGVMKVLQNKGKRVVLDINKSCDYLLRCDAYMFYCALELEKAYNCLADALEACPDVLFKKDVRSVGKTYQGKVYVFTVH